jgi:DNA-binding transcriptional ArsR family regulator
MAVSPFDAIADPTRRHILDRLRRQGPQRAGDLAAAFRHISRPAVSKHLGVLRRAGLIRPERRGREMWYRLDPVPLAQVQRWMQRYEDFWQQKLENLKRSAEG